MVPLAQRLPAGGDCYHQWLLLPCADDGPQAGQLAEQLARGLPIPAETAASPQDKAAHRRRV